MTSDPEMSLTDALERWESFEECLIHDVRPVRYGYGVDIAINIVWAGGKVRPDVLQNPDLVTLRLLGVESLRFVGGLTDDMKRDPGAINWGLAEISHIVDSSSDESAAITVHWPGDRSLFVQYLNLEILVSRGDPEPGPHAGDARVQDNVSRLRVNSEGVLSVGYDSATSTLEVEFVSGGIFRYLDVPELVFKQLIASESVARFVNTRVKPHYEAEAV